MTDRIAAVVGAFVAFLLQVFLAPHIAIAGIVPNFMAAYCLAIAVARGRLAGLLLPFVVGLVFDLLSGGPVGAMAFSLTAVSAFGSWLVRRANNDTSFMGALVLALSVLVLEVIFGLFYLLFGYSAGFFEALAYRMLPCFLYDFLIALAVFMVGLRFFGRGAVVRSEITQL